MANIRVKDLPNTNTAADTDEFIIDSSTAGTRRLSYSELKSEISTDFAADVATYGIATLDSDNKLTASQIPDSLAQGMNFVGVANSAGDLTSTTQGDFYVIQTAFGSYNVGDQAVYDGSAYVRVVDGTKEIAEGGTGATTLDAAKTNLEIIDVGTGPSQVPLNQYLGDLAFQSSDGVSIATLEVTDHIENFTVKSDGTSDSPAEITLQAEDGSINTNDRIGTLSIAGMDSSATPLTGAKIEAKADSTWSASTAPTRLEFATTPSGSTTPSVRAVIDNQGRVGIGNSSPGSYHSNANNLVVGDTSGNSGITIATGTTGSSTIHFADGTSGTERYRGFASYTHSNDALSFGTGAVTQWQINSSGNLVAYSAGNGIDFGSTTTGTGTVATNGGLLADYEFGYFTVTAGGTWTVTPTTMAGRYVKVGNLVTCWVTFGGSPSKTSATSGWLEGLPFATNVYNGQGSVSDTSVADRGNCYAANVNRLWLTGTSFGANNYATVTYRHD